MSLSSSFTDFSLAELFLLIEQGRKSGCLSVCTLPDLHITGSKSQHYYIWFRQGRVVAAANRLNGNGLITKIAQRGWGNKEEIEKLLDGASAVTPLGLHLKTQAVLGAEQLNLLFASQLQQVRELFEIQKGVFKLDSKAVVPVREMTGLSLRATEVALMALRILKNWEVLSDALPSADSAIKSITKTQPEQRLNPLEWQVWEFASGRISLNSIASRLNKSRALVQQAAFRLMLAGLVEEVPPAIFGVEIAEYPLDENLVSCSTSRTKVSEQPGSMKVSSSFLQNLVGYLRTKS